MQGHNGFGLLRWLTRTQKPAGAVTGSDDVRRRPRRRSFITVLAVSLTVIGGMLSLGALPASALPQTTIDEDGANDEPNQKDLNLHTVDSANVPTSISVSWNWDDLGTTGGGQTMDACALFDTNGDARVNYAICVVTSGTPAVQLATSPRLYSCDDDKVDRCTNPVQDLTISSTCSVAQTSTDPFPGPPPSQQGDFYPLDTTATCTIQLLDVGGAGADLVNTCSYPSQQPNSDPSDCVVIPRDGFLVIEKVADPDDSLAEFDFTLDGGATPVFTANGSETSLAIPIASSITHSLAEALPSGWELDSASCAKQGGASTGTLSGSTISGIDAEEDETTTCTFNNSLQTGTLLVKKAVTNDNGGTAVASAFNLHVKSAGTDVTGSPAAGSATGTSYTLEAGGYVVSEDTPPTGYTQTGFSDDCDSGGNVTVPPGGSATCTITNNDIAPKLHLRKEVTNNNGGGALATRLDPERQRHRAPTTSRARPRSTPTARCRPTPGRCLRQRPIRLHGHRLDLRPAARQARHRTSSDKITVGVGGEATCTITTTTTHRSCTCARQVTNNNGGGAARHRLDPDRDRHRWLADEPVGHRPRSTATCGLQGRHLHAGRERTVRLHGQQTGPASGRARHARHRDETQRSPSAWARTSPARSATMTTLRRCTCSKAGHQQQRWRRSAPPPGP